MNQEHYNVALAGCPNSGKSALFNALTGGRQKVANYPGVTVEQKSGLWRGRFPVSVKVVDLPGLYSLDAQSPDEAITREILEGHNAGLLGDGVPQLVVLVADATHLEKSLSLLLEVQSLGRPVILALNMMDLARKRGIEFDLEKLSQSLGVRVVAVSATKREGFDKLHAVVAAELERLGESGVRRFEPLSLDALKVRRFKVAELLKQVRRARTLRDEVSFGIDRVLMHPVAGTLVLACVLVLMFQAVFSWAGPFQDAIEAGLGALGEAVSGVTANPLVRSLLADGLIAGVGSVLVFLPQILILFLFIFFLEASGYMARAAFLLDRLMSGFGLPGKAFVPLLSSFACAIPGIMATRTLPNHRDRLVTMMIAPLMTCAARLPVYVLLVSAFIPNRSVGGLGLQGLVMFALYVAALVSGIAVAWVFRRTLLKGARSAFILEMPSYRWPDPKQLLINLWQRTYLFLKRAGTVILGLSFVLWILASFPRTEFGAPAVEDSFAGQIGHFVEPVFAPLGFDWRISTALIPSFAAREVMVAALGTVYAVEGADEEAQGEALRDVISREWSLATGLSLLGWYLFAPQCLATLAVVRRETQSWRWPAFMLFYLTALAYLTSFVIYQSAVFFS